MKHVWMVALVLLMLAACKPEPAAVAPPAAAAKPAPARPALIPEVAERPALRIATLDGKTFDPADPMAYLKSLSIKRAAV